MKTLNLLLVASLLGLSSCAFSKPKKPIVVADDLKISIDNCHDQWCCYENKGDMLLWYSQDSQMKKIRHICYRNEAYKEPRRWK